MDALDSPIFPRQRASLHSRHPKPTPATHGFGSEQLRFDLSELGPHPLRDREPPQPEASGPSLPANMREPQEIERLGLTPTPCRPVPGGVRPELDQPGFVRVQRQTELHQPLAKIGQQSLRVGLVLETHDEVVREADDDHITVRLVTSPPCHPQVKDVVGSPRGFSPRGSHGTERDTLASFRSSHPIQENTRTQAQWANIAGSLATSPSHQTLNRRYVLSRLNFFRAHRVK